MTNGTNAVAWQRTANAWLKLLSMWKILVNTATATAWNVPMYPGAAGIEIESANKINNIPIFAKLKSIPTPFSTSIYV